MIRDLRLFIEPQLWAEEGTIYFREAYLYGFKTIFKPELGYYSLLPRTFSYVSSLLPLETVPMFMILFSLSIWLVPHILISLSQNERLHSFKNKIICSFTLILLTGPSEEIFLNSINLHFVVPWILILIGMDNLNQISKARNILYVFLSWIALLNGPVAIFVLPIYIYLVLSQKKYKFLIFSLFPVLIQIYSIFILNNNNSLHNRFSFSMEEFNLVYFYRILLGSFVGEIGSRYSILNLIDIQSWIKLKNVLFLFFTGLVLFAIKERDKFASSLMIGSATVSILTYIFAVNPKYPDLLIGGGRYFYLPNTMLVIGYLFFCFKKVNFRIPATLIYVIPIILSLFSSGISYFNKSSYCLDCASWKTEVHQNFRQNKKIQISPKGWIIDFNQ
ncbi:putative membrane protein [Leptospira alstonii serovar Sichuan str. 79601]|nr:putative membrane protein [Leptospira alstonii serovar Sichuan str. 79601]